MMPTPGRRRAVRRACPHLPPLVLSDGRVALDWRSHPVERRAGPCRICAAPALLRDCAGARCHKRCAEAEAARDLATGVHAYTARSA